MRGFAERLTLILAVVGLMSCVAGASEFDDEYANWIVVSKTDPSIAMQGVESLADRGHQRSQLAIAHCYLFDNCTEAGIGMDADQAMKWYGRAADEHGNAQAHFMMGIGYTYGLGLPVHHELAAIHYSFAARGRHNPALLALGYRRFFGIHSPTSCAESLQHYRVVADRVAERFREVGQLPSLRRTNIHVANSLNRPTQERELLEYFQYLGEQSSDGDMQSALGYRYYHGRLGAERDVNTSIYWFQKAAEEHKFPEALCQLGHIRKYAQDESARNLVESLYLYQLGATINKKHQLCVNGLAVWHMQGLQLPSDVVFKLLEGREKWVGWNWREASQIRKAYDGIYDYLKERRTGENTESTAERSDKQYIVLSKDEEKARVFFTECSKRHAECMYNLGVLEKQRGDNDRAIQRFKEASRGHPLAKYELGIMNSERFRLRGSHAFCEEAVNAFRSLTEHANENADALFFGYEDFVSWHRNGSFIHYLIGAEMGNRNAAVNAISLLEESLRTAAGGMMSSSKTLIANWRNKALSTDRLLYLLKWSAYEGSGYAHAKMGDHFADLGESAKAIECYEQAIQKNYAPAAFQLGLMYHFGFGGVRQDFHLAKRHYDRLARFDPGPAVAKFVLHWTRAWNVVRDSGFWAWITRPELMMWDDPEDHTGAKTVVHQKQAPRKQGETLHVHPAWIEPARAMKRLYHVVTERYGWSHVLVSLLLLILIVVRLRQR